MTIPPRPSSLGPWLLACVLVICATALVLTGHQDVIGPAAAVCLIVLFFVTVFICL